MSRRSWLIALSLCALLFASCQSAYYKTMKTFGKEKRDILVKRVIESKKDQQETKEKVQTTLESFQELTGFQGGDLEKAYKKLNSQYESAQGQANKLHDRIQSIDQVSNDLFKEWQSEIDQMGSAKLKAQSAAMLRDSKQRQATYMTAMRKTESQVTPVLKSFQDQVMFLKHNLNARAIGSLKGTSAQINTDVTALTKSIDNSIQEADKLISSLSAPDANSN
jgi:chromosome segregation ATPase